MCTSFEAVNKKRELFIFGPVPSRRLGRSLGIDLVPFKTCTYDCLYCQLGRTTHKTVSLTGGFDSGWVISQLQEKLPARPDYITLSGSGEPTLCAGIGDLIRRIRDITDIPVAVLTNGSLLCRANIRRQLAEAHLVIPSLDAGDAAMFDIVNRPHPSLSFEGMLEGLIRFRQEYTGKYWLETVLLRGYTALPAEVAKIAACVEKIKPDRLQLNTATRPPAEACAVPVEAERLHALAEYFNPPAEVVADFRSVHSAAEFQAGAREIFEMLRRRPCTADDIAAGLNIHRNEVAKYLEELTALNKIELCPVDGRTYYQALKTQDRDAGV